MRQPDEYIANPGRRRYRARQEIVGTRHVVISHFTLLMLFSAFVSGFFAVLLRPTIKGIVRLFSIFFLSMVGGALIWGWFMYLFAR